MVERWGICTELVKGRDCGIASAMHLYQTSREAIVATTCPNTEHIMSRARPTQGVLDPGRLAWGVRATYGDPIKIQAWILIGS